MRSAARGHSFHSLVSVVDVPKVEFVLSASSLMVMVQVANHVSSRCVEMMGGMGFIKDNAVEKFYGDSKISEGNNVTVPVSLV